MIIVEKVVSSEPFVVETDIHEWVTFTIQPCNP